MKHLFTISAAIFYLTSVMAQPTQTLLDENKLWSTLWQSASGSPPPQQLTTTFIKFMGDTLIEEEHYMKVYESTDSIRISFYLIGFIREDADHKIYYRDKNEAISGLIYDFGAEVNDTIQLRGNATVNLVVDLVDSVLINDKYLRRWHLLDESGYGSEQWIEGIGSLCGILASGTAGFAGGHYELLCYFEQEDLVYSNPEYEACYYNIVGTEAHIEAPLKVQVWPNPIISTSIISIEGIWEHNLSMEVYALEGIKVRTYEFVNNQLLIYRNDYTPGMYLYQVKSGDAVVHAGKFIVH